MSGLQIIHGRGYAQGDINPQNLLVGHSGNGKELFVQIIDYGLARKFEYTEEDCNKPVSWGCTLWGPLRIHAEKDKEKGKGN